MVNRGRTSVSSFQFATKTTPINTAPSLAPRQAPKYIARPFQFRAPEKRTQSSFGLNRRNSLSRPRAAWSVQQKTNHAENVHRTSSYQSKPNFRLPSAPRNAKNLPASPSFPARREGERKWVGGAYAPGIPGRNGGSDNETRSAAAVSRTRTKRGGSSSRSYIHTYMFIYL